MLGMFKMFKMFLSNYLDYSIYVKGYMTVSSIIINMLYLLLLTVIVKKYYLEVKDPDI